MSKITEAFKKGKAFIPFLTAGDPDADVEYLRALQETLEKVHEQH